MFIPNGGLILTALNSFENMHICFIDWALLFSLSAVVKFIFCLSINVDEIWVDTVALQVELSLATPVSHNGVVV